MFSDEENKRKLIQHCSFRNIDRRIDDLIRREVPNKVIKKADSSIPSLVSIADILCTCQTQIPSFYLAKKNLSHRLLLYLLREGRLTKSKKYIVVSESSDLLEKHSDWLTPELAILRSKLLLKLEQAQGMEKTGLYLTTPELGYADMDMLLGSLKEDDRLQQFNFGKRGKRLFTHFELPLKSDDANSVISQRYHKKKTSELSLRAVSCLLGINRPYERLESFQKKLDEFELRRQERATIEV